MGQGQDEDDASKLKVQLLAWRCRTLRSPDGWSSAFNDVVALLATSSNNPSVHFHLQKALHPNQRRLEALCTVGGNPAEGEQEVRGRT